MPDLDKVERNLPPAWRPAYKLVKGGQPIEEVARAVLKVVTRTLREKGGAPELRELAEILHRRDAGLLDDRSLAAVVDRLKQRMKTRNGRLVVAALLRPDVSGPASILLGPPDERLAQGLLVRMVENVLLSRQRNYLIGTGKRFASLQEAIKFESELMAVVRPRLGELARRLVKDPSANRLRAPSFPGAKRKSTKELLDQPL